MSWLLLGLNLTMPSVHIVPFARDQGIDLGTAALLGTPSAALLPILMAVYGFGFAGSDTVFVRVIPDVFGLRALGAIMGVLSLGWRCGAALGPSLTGFMYDLTGSYALPFGTAPVATLISYGLYRIAAKGRRPGGSP